MLIRAAEPLGVSRRSPTVAVPVQQEPQAGCGRIARRLLGRPDSFCWQEAEIFSDFELHAVNLGQEAGNGGPVIHRIGLRLAQMRHLVLKPGDAFQSRLELLIVFNHVPSGRISTMPQNVPTVRSQPRVDRDG